mgnify:CR=1 FL=1
MDPRGQSVSPSPFGAVNRLAGRPMSPWLLACIALWWGGRAAALWARGAGWADLLPLWGLPLGLIADWALVVALFRAHRWLGAAATPAQRRWRHVPRLLLVASALLRTVDILHGVFALSHISVGFWWHFTWSAWPLLVESGALAALGVAAGWGWFGWRALGRDLQRMARSRELASPRPGAALAVATLLLLTWSASAAWVDHPQHPGLVPEVQALRSWLAFHGWRPPSSARPPDLATWRRWQTAGLVPATTSPTDPSPLWHGRPAPRQPPEPIKNVVLVFLESFNAGLTSPYGGDALARGVGHDGPLTPNLARLAKRAAVVDSYFTQARPTHFGLLASLCGLLPGSWPLDTRLHGRPPPRLRCLPTVLAEGGFETIFLQGSRLPYTGMDLMLERIGFAERAGREVLGRRFPEAPRNAWGLYDREVYIHAIERMANLRRAGRPSFMTIATVDSHLPGTPRPDCRPPAGLAADPILAAVYCADAELGLLLDAFDQGDWWRDTLLVVTADHAMQDVPELRRHLRGPQAGSFAQLPLLIAAPSGRLPRRWSAQGGQVDLARTLAGLLGAWPGQSTIQGRDLVVDSAPGRPIVGQMGRRLVGIRVAEAQRELSYGALARACADGEALLPGSAGGLGPCDLSRYLTWMDGLWFAGRLGPGVDAPRR